MDHLVAEKGLAATRAFARSLIMAGWVQVDGRKLDKPGALVRTDVVVTLKERPRFVSRGGDKLAHALSLFQVQVGGRLCMDVGASTGGFVDCLLQNGARMVIALDVGYGQLHSRLRADPRVMVLDRVNARYLTAGRLPFTPDVLTVDVSFISLEKLLPAVLDCMAKDFVGVILAKPQFEAGPGSVGKGGVVRDPGVHEAVLVRLCGFFAASGLAVEGVCDSGLRGADGNREFFLLVTRGRGQRLGPATLMTCVRNVVGAVDNDEQ